MNIIVTIIITLLMLSVLVVFHEFGHFIAAKKCGVYVIEFSVGMGPLLFSIKGKETRFSLRALPVGGFCRMYGEKESDESENKEDIPEDMPPDRDFRNKPKGQRFLILIAGAMMNIFFALVVLFLIYLFRGAGIVKALTYAPMTAWDYGTSILKSLGAIFTGGVSINDFSGPVGMVSMVGDAAQYGISILLALMCYISVNLGVINLLPFPALDGGQALLLIFEKIAGKDVDRKIANIINLAGFALLMGLVLLVTVKDVIRLF